MCVDLLQTATIWLSASLPPAVPLMRGSDGGFVGPASQALSLPWFATDLGAGVAEMVDAEACQVSGRKPVPVRIWSPVPPHRGACEIPCIGIG
jgi:hypothetical protein